MGALVALTLSAPLHLGIRRALDMRGGWLDALLVQSFALLLQAPLWALVQLVGGLLGQALPTPSLAPAVARLALGTPTLLLAGLGAWAARAYRQRAAAAAAAREKTLKEAAERVANTHDCPNCGAHTFVIERSWRSTSFGGGGGVMETFTNGLCGACGHATHERTHT